jgi:hypothetical protein
MPSLEKYVVATALAALCTATAADTPQEACQQDIQLQCDRVQPGGGRVLACLKEHEKDVSTNCKVILQMAKEAVQKLSAACNPDIEQFCMNTPKGQGAIVNCLRNHQKELSPGCKDAFAKAKEKRQHDETQQ